MKRLIRIGLAGCLTALLSTTALRGAEAAGPPSACSGSLTIFTTSVGTVTASGPVTHYRGSGVGGAYTSGPLASYTLSGAQAIMVNSVTQQSELQGAYTAVGPGGSVVVRYTGHANLATGIATGHFETAGGTGDFAAFHWAGAINAQLVSMTPPTFLAADSGPCLIAS